MSVRKLTPEQYAIYFGFAQAAMQGLLSGYSSTGRGFDISSVLKTSYECAMRMHQGCLNYGDSVVGDNEANKIILGEKRGSASL